MEVKREKYVPVYRMFDIFIDFSTILPKPPSNPMLYHTRIHKGRVTYVKVLANGPVTCYVIM